MQFSSTPFARGSTNLFSCQHRAALSKLIAITSGAVTCTGTTTQNVSFKMDYATARGIRRKISRRYRSARRSLQRCTGPGTLRAASARARQQRSEFGRGSAAGLNYYQHWVQKPVALACANQPLDQALHRGIRLSSKRIAKPYSLDQTRPSA